ncbi:MAG: GNAT family N-acetyltransferase [Vicingaceae bacterium]|nr:GNAT family N-acetyltransferase [Vicingaceae bacterium]
MKIIGYGIELHRLTQKDIELVRKHRNSTTINQYMEFRDPISEEQQKQWFQSINNLNNNYYIIIHQNNKIGLIYGAEINWDKLETGNGGIFIWDTYYWDSMIPACASILLTDTSILLGLKRTYIKVLKDNIKAIAFNKMLGYKICENQNQNNQQYVLAINDYKLKREKLIKNIFDLPNEQKQILFDTKSEIDMFYVNRIKKQPIENRQLFETKLI